MHLRGTIDRVDVSADGAAVGIVDYKTGESEQFPRKLGMEGRGGVTAEREKVQDLIYDVAARAIYYRMPARSTSGSCSFPTTGRSLSSTPTREPDRLRTAG